jgi:hypothetical protein
MGIADILYDRSARTGICRNCGNTGEAWSGGLCPCLKDSERFLHLVVSPAQYEDWKSSGMNMAGIFQSRLLPIEEEPISISHWGMHDAS